MTPFQWTKEGVIEFMGQFATLLSPAEQKQALADFKASKQPKPEWEIVKFKELYDGGYVYPVIEGKIGPFSNAMNISDWFISKQYYKIHSVRRLSDGEVFTVGERRLDKNRGCFHITAFEIVGNQMWVTGPDGSQIGLDRMLCRKDEPGQMPPAANGKVPVWLTPEEEGKLRRLLALFIDPMAGAVKNPKP